jgi:hypothetical protein
MNDLNNNDTAESTTEELNTPDFTDTPHTPEITETVAAVSRKGYQNTTARLLNMVFVVLLVVMGIFLILQLYLNVAGYLQQGRRSVSRCSIRWPASPTPFCSARCLLSSNFCRSCGADGQTSVLTSKQCAKNGCRYPRQPFLCFFLLFAFDNLFHINGNSGFFIAV